MEVDQAEIPFRADNSFFDPVKSGKILIAGAVEVIDRGTNQVCLPIMLSEHSADGDRRAK